MYGRLIQFVIKVFISKIRFVQYVQNHELRITNLKCRILNFKSQIPIGFLGVRTETTDLFNF